MRRLIGVLVFLTLLASTAATEPYVPPTVDQARQYMAEQPDLAAADLVELNIILNADPVVTLPEAAVIVTGSDVAVAWQGAIDITIADSLHYRVTMQPVVAKNILPVAPWWIIPAWAAGGAISGALIALLVVALLR
jgi:hypothetical protein